MAEDKFYRVYSYQDELETGKCIKFRHEISFDESKADLTELVALSRSELESRINESKSKETAIFQKLKGAISEWEVQGANTMLLECALEYVRTPEVSVACRSCCYRACCDSALWLRQTAQKE